MPHQVFLIVTTRPPQSASEERETRKSLAGGLEKTARIRSLRRESGKTKIGRLADSTREVNDPDRRKFLTDRVERLDQWMRSGSKVLPILQKILGQ